MNRNRINLIKFGYGTLLAVITTLGIMQGCKKDDFSYQEQTRSVFAYEEMAADTSLSIAVQALEKSNLAPTLNTYGPFTFFAPDNNAFRKFFADNGKSGLDAFTADELKAIMIYHIMQVRLKSSDFIQGPQAQASGAGDFISLDISKGFKENTVANSIARIYKTDIEYANALVHKIDAVLNPPTQSIGQFLDQNKSQYSIMIAGLKRTALWDTLNSLTNTVGTRVRITLFAEPDAVWKAAGIQTLENMPLDELNTLLRYHIIPGANFSASYTKKTEANATIGLVERWDSTVTSLNGWQWLYFDLAAEKLINSVANFAASDVIMRNGVVHVVDKHIEWHPGVKRTQIYHWFRTATSWAYGLPRNPSNQAPAINGSGDWRTFGENGREFVFFNPDGVGDSMITVVKNVRLGKYKIEVSYKAGARGTYQLMFRDEPIGVPTYIGPNIGTINGGLYNQKLVLGTYNFTWTGDLRLNFVTTALPGVAFDNLVLTPVYQ